MSSLLVAVMAYYWFFASQFQLLSCFCERYGIVAVYGICLSLSADCKLPSILFLEWMKSILFQFGKWIDYAASLTAGAKNFPLKGAWSASRDHLKILPPPLNIFEMDVATLNTQI